MYQLNSENNYIISIVSGVSPEASNLTEEEYNKIIETLKLKPQSRQGFDFKLKTDLTWEEYELPAVTVDENGEIGSEELLAMMEDIL